ASLERAMEAARPDAVLHCAALADADRCQAEPARAQRTNVEATAGLARLCHRRGVRLVMVSTDLVLPGDRAWTAEATPAAPVLVYGRTKLEAEEAAIAEAMDAAIARVALVLGRGFGPRRTASEAIAATLAGGGRVRAFTDQFRTAVDPESVADAIARM